MHARFFFACLLVWFAWTTPDAQAAGAAPRPVTVQELTLLLHGGYTGDEVLRETARRPLLTSLDDASEKALRDAGATQRLIDALKASRPALTDAEADAARQQQAAIDARNAEGKAAYVSRMYDANKQAFQDNVAARKQAALGQMAAGLQGKLVVWRNDRLEPFDADTLAKKKLFAYYFSASSDRACRQFTPTLVKFYQDFAPKHPAFEVVLVSRERSAAELESYLRQAGLPFPTVAYESRVQEGLAKAAQTREVPYMVVIDGTGRVVLDGTVNGKPAGPLSVLDGLTRLAAAGGN